MALSQTTTASMLSAQSLMQKWTQHRNLSFNYGLTYLTKGLGDGHQDGGTYNRFKTGQDYKGDNTDYHASYQLYHAFSLGYRVGTKLSLSYSYTFQEDLNKNIKYDVYNSDGSVFATNERPTGLSYNNQRLNAFISNVFNNQIFYMHINTFTEFPTTETSKNQNMYYGFGIEPSLGIYTTVPGLFTGFNISAQRNIYDDQEFQADWCKPDCMYNTRYQTLLVSISPYLNYMLTDKVTLNSSLSFDWDQQGDQVYTREFNHNMDNVLELGLTYYLLQKFSLGSALQAALDEPSVDKTAIKMNMFLSI